LLTELERELNEYGSQVLTERDGHGWQVLHQGVAGGSEEVVEFLVSNGADINARTHGGYGETPLRIAESRLGLNSNITKYLKQKGALSIGPEL
jgi:ankyrin repeat protein